MNREDGYFLSEVGEVLELVEGALGKLVVELIRFSYDFKFISIFKGFIGKTLG